MSALSYADPGRILSAQPSNGLGHEARHVQNLVADFREEFFNSISLGGALQVTLDKLDHLYEECNQPDLDGCARLPVTQDIYLAARQFIESLPGGLRAPELAVDPDGEVSFEWYQSPRKVFSISVGPNKTLSYAGLFGAGKTYGTESFHDEIPRGVLDNVRRVAA